MQLFQALLMVIVLAIGLAYVAFAIIRRTRAGGGTAGGETGKPRHTGRFNAGRSIGQKLGGDRRKATVSEPPPTGERRRAGDSLVQTASYYTDAETYDAVISRLDRAFDLFERKRISQETFYELALIEKKGLLQRRADLAREDLASGTQANVPAIEDIDEAISAVKWCIDWCEQQAEHEGPLEVRHAAE